VGLITAPIRETRALQERDVFFPGLAIFVLAMIGLFAAIYTKRLRIGLLIGAVTSWVLAMGLGRRSRLPLPSAVRLCARLERRARARADLHDGHAVSSRCSPARARSGSSGACAGARGPRAATGAGSAGGRSWHPRRRRARPSASWEGAGHLGHPVVPQPARAEIGLPAAPGSATDGTHDRIWQYFSTDGFYDIPIGNSTFDMPAWMICAAGMSGFPDRAKRREASLLRNPHGRPAHKDYKGLPSPQLRHPEPPTRSPRRPSR